MELELVGNDVPLATFQSLMVHVPESASILHATIVEANGMRR
jgi:hypothetical protein